MIFGCIKTKSRDRGFTLIELLVVVAIIGILSTVVISSLNTARSKSRDARRKMDLKQIEKALEFHYDKYGSYTQPENLDIDSSVGSTAGTSAAYPNGKDWDPSSDLRDLVVNGFMSSLPVDPINNATYKYQYEPWNADQSCVGCPAGRQYDLCATLESGGTFCINKR